MIYYKLKDDIKDKKSIKIVENSDENGVEKWRHDALKSATFDLRQSKKVSGMIYRRRVKIACRRF